MQMESHYYYWRIRIKWVGVEANYLNLECYSKLILWVFERITLSKVVTGLYHLVNLLTIQIFAQNLLYTINF